MDAKVLYTDYLIDIKLMQLATSRDEQPWLCNVWYVLNEDSGHFYFISRETRRHSEEIRDNPRVSCTFHKWFDGGLGEQGQALIVSGKARQLSPKECDKPYDLYAARYPKLLAFQSKEATLDESGHHFFYEIVPEEIIWWDEVNFADQPRQKVL